MITKIFPFYSQEGSTYLFYGIVFLLINTLGDSWMNISEISLEIEDYFDYFAIQADKIEPT